MKLYESGEYRATKDWPYSISAGCVVYKTEGNKTLVALLRKASERDKTSAGGNNDSYHLPKGHVEFAETLSKAATRETEEETGIKVEIESYAGVVHWDILHPSTNFATKKTVHYFVARHVEDSHDMDTEHDEVVWVNLEEAEKLLGPPNPKGEDEIIRRLKKFLELTK